MSRHLHALWRMSRGRGLTSAGLAFVLLLALMTAQKALPEQADGTLTLGPTPPAVVATAAPKARAVAAPRAAAAPRRVARQAPRVAAAPKPKKKKAAPKTVPAYRAMKRSYYSDAHGESLCPAGTQSTSLELTCRGAEVRAAASGYVLHFQVCPTTATTFELHFRTEAEVGMSVLDALTGRPVWTWKPPRPFADEPHTLVSTVGACWVWQTPWAQVDDRGRKLPDAMYDLQVDFLEIEDGETYSHRFFAEGA